MLEWFDKSLVPIYNKPKRAKLEEIPLPAICSFKYDGELAFTYVGDEVFTVNRWGRVRADYSVTEALKRMVLNRGVYIGELYCQDGNLYEFLKNRRNVERLRLAIFDVALSKPYAERWQLLTKMFTENGVVHLVKARWVYTRQQLEDFYREAVNSGFEGIVCRSPNELDEGGWKVKKVETADTREGLESLLLFEEATASLQPFRVAEM